QTTDIEIELKEITLQLEIGCLWWSRFCFENLRAEHLEIRLPPGDDSIPRNRRKKKTPNKLIVFPYELKAVQLQLGRTDIYWHGGQWSHGQTHARVHIKDSRITVSDLHAKGPYLQVTDMSPMGEAVSDEITLPTLDIPLELVVENLELENPSWKLHGKQGQLRVLNLSGEWENRDLRIDQLEIDNPQFARIELAGAMQFSGHWRLNVLAKGKSTQPPIWSELHNLPFKLELAGDLAHLSVKGETFGSRQISLQGNVNTLNRTLPFEFAASAEWESILPLQSLPGVPKDLPKIDLVAPWSLSASGAVQSPQFNLQTFIELTGLAKSHLTVAGRYKPSRLFIEQATLRDITSENVLDLTGELIGGEQIDWRLTAETKGFNIPAIDSRVSGRLAGGFQMKGSVGENKWTVAVDQLAVQGEINGLPASINGHLASSSERYIFEANLNAELNGAQLILEGSEQVHASLDLRDMGRWYVDSYGSLAIKAVYKPDDQTVVVNGTARELVWQTLMFEQGAIKGQYKIDGSKVFDLALKMDGIEQGGERLESLNIIATGDSDTQSVMLQSEGKLKGELVLTGQPTSMGWVGELLPGTLSTPLGIWQLRDPVAVAWVTKKQQITLAPHCWYEQEVDLCPTEIVLGKKGKAVFDISGDIGFMQRLLPLGFGLAGKVELSTAVQWSEDKDLVAKGNITLKSGELSQPIEDSTEPAKLYWKEGRGSFRYDSNQLSLDGDLRLSDNRGITIQLAVPKDRQREISGQLTCDQLDLSLLRPFVPTLVDLQGRLDGSVKFSGTLAQPLGYGEMRLTGGQLQAIANPTPLTAANLTLELQGNKAQISGHMLLGEGELDINGHFLLSPAMRMELYLTGDNHSILLPPGTTVKASENISLITTDKSIEVKGEITIHEGLIELDQLPEESVAISPDVIVIDASTNTSGQIASQLLGLDLKINIEDNFKVVDTQIDVVGGGDLHILKKPQYPMELYGDLSVSRGALYAYGQSLQVDEGRLNFVGAADNPRLNVRSERDITQENVTVGMEIKGTMKAPEINIYSRPAMSQAEAMSYLIRGRG
ncbi:MAG: translocation/assembly module TamB domain-containing protein, partial [Pseudomonadales bacterium]|nr:translocation/assembly module TamB domain-containing protein [Pseudomonadales bacterium]